MRRIGMALLGLRSTKCAHHKPARAEGLVWRVWYFLGCVWTSRGSPRLLQSRLFQRSTFVGSWNHLHIDEWTLRKHQWRPRQTSQHQMPLSIDKSETSNISLLKGSHQDKDQYQPTTTTLSRNDLWWQLFATVLCYWYLTSPYLWTGLLLPLYIPGETKGQ